MPERDLLAPTASDGRGLLQAAASDWSRPIPQCPEWDAADLVAHMGSILAWMATIVTTGQRVSRRDRETAPAERAALAGWYSDHLTRTLHVLTSADPTAEAWTFSSRGDQRVQWWRRRLAVELAIHRWDAQHAASVGDGPPPQPLDSDIAAAGIEEFLVEFLPGLLAQDGVNGLGGTVHLQATDGPTTWSIDLDARADAVAVRGHARSDTEIRGTGSDLLLWLTNRHHAYQLEVLGRPEVVTHWGQLRR